MSETDIPKLNCRNKNCGSDDTLVEWHSGRLTWLIRCRVCKSPSWQPNEGSKARPSAHKDLVKRRGINYCELCMRKREELPAPETLEGHHVIEYKDEKQNDINNIWVLCTACHKLVLWLRTYFGHQTKAI